MISTRTTLQQRIGVLLVCGALGTGGCSAARPPTEAVAQAELAVQQAGQSKAPQYASRELSMARDKFDSAKRAMERARASYMQAQQNSVITTYAPTALHDAQQSLQRAEVVWQNEKDTNEVAHLAYVTEQRVEVARSTADKKVVEGEIQQLSEERERILLTARTREAERAQQQAEARGREAEQARLQAQDAADRAHQLA